MFPSVRQAIACILYALIAATCSQAQVTPAKGATASISGKVTIRNKPLPGIVVIARDQDRGGDRGRYRATTDQTGNFRIPNLPPGSYQIAPISRSFVRERDLFMKSLVIEEGDTIEGINFAMVRGGVITGKVIDSDGKPMIEEQVFLMPLERPYVPLMQYNTGIVTDDRGVYRAFGLPQGKYKVYVGQSDNRLPGGPNQHRQTFHPSAADAAEASVVEVTEGGEAKNIDITLDRPVKGYKVTGRIVDGETGKPVAGMKYGVHRIDKNGNATSSSVAGSNANGEFKFEGVLPGKYSVFIEPEQDMNIRADWVPLEVVDRDVTDVIVKTAKACSISGVVVIESTDGPVTKFQNLYVNTMVEFPGSRYQGGSSVAVKPDGSFTLAGLQKGAASFSLSAAGNNSAKNLALVRIELDGVPQPDGVIGLNDRDQITGLRLIGKFLTGSIRGSIKVEEGQLSADAHMSAWVKFLGESPPLRMGGTSSRLLIDSRGRFLIEGLAAGTYELNIVVFQSEPFDANQIFKQVVTVTDNAVIDVTVPVKLKP
ncbi:MAG TPA: carboxypeptidase regulatory-like domain-containing protein [Pyrinomonadaceae bacterium]|nr:carboxypeptidase regulatory-like domain-containing protein [Pyrinomonadaceae bacterium]